MDEKNAIPETAVIEDEQWMTEFIPHILKRNRTKEERENYSILKCKILSFYVWEIE